MGGAALPFGMLNSNKKPVTLNLKTEKGRDLLREMVARADVLVDNFAPGVTDRLGSKWPQGRLRNDMVVTHGQ
jgi:CoA:oxalate CoA-transferase